MGVVATGEKARRRDPRTVNYAGIACPEMKRVRSTTCGRARCSKLLEG